jgi:succinyl-CoA synthetase beta subunit
MKIHEYQAKQVLKPYGVDVPEGVLCFTADEAEAAAKKLGTDVVIVKAQIHAGGRGKGGGVKLAKSPAEAKQLASEILGMQLVTHQTGPEGQKVRRVYVEQGLQIDHEYYLGAVMDRDTAQVAFMASTEGGMEIEEVAEKHPEKIIKVFVDPLVGLTDFQARQLGFGIGLKGPQLKSAMKLVKALYTAFVAEDCSLAEINPMITSGDKVIALDAKINFDDNAMYRHPNLEELRDVDEEDPLEIEATKNELNYIKLDGTIGCMVNGAGLAMATMDIIKHYGGEPANFLDVGGSATKERVIKAFEIILSDKNVNAILVNIFGGIMKCDIIAAGVIGAAKAIDLKVPVVVRLQGTNADAGRELLEKSGLNLIAENDLEAAARKIVEVLK